MVASNGLQEWIARLDRRLYALLIGITIGAMGGGVGLLLALTGPIITFGLVLGVLAGLYILTSLNAALYGIIFVLALLPFGTFPFKIGFTPTLLDAAMGAFILVYILQFMTGRRRGIRLTPVHTLVALYMGWLILSFVLGIRYARPTSANLRQFAETLLSIGMVFVLVDVLYDGKALRRLLLTIAIAATAQAVITLGLYLLNDQAAERTLIRLARIGYPSGGVIRSWNGTSWSGWKNLGGDLASALNPLGDLYKTQVRELSKALGVPKAILSKAPSADLWPEQTDERDLGFSYRDADRILALLVDARMSAPAIARRGYPRAVVLKIQELVIRSQYKRRMPVIAKVSTRSVGWDFRYPRDWRS
jgi:hypothetical protein